MMMTLNRAGSTSPRPVPRSKNNSPMSTASGPANNNNNNATTGSSGTHPESPGTNTNNTKGSCNNVESNALPKFTYTHPSTGDIVEIRNVWSDNVEEEMAHIRELVETHPFVAMDTEFPGVVVRPVSESYSPDYHYKSLKCNVDLLKIIQLGLSFADSEGNLAPGCPCWQFNFHWDWHRDIYAQDSIDLLINSGISFDDHEKRGINPLLFGELLMVSGLVLEDNVKWVSYHSGYDYAYLLKLLTTRELPGDEKGFFELLHTYFPTIYDIKYMTSVCDGHFGGGLQRLADDLNCPRIGSEHQAGSDSLLTMTTYFALSKQRFGKKKKKKSGADGEDAFVVVVDDSRYRNELFGYGSNHTVRRGGSGSYGGSSGGGGGVHNTSQAVAPSVPTTAVTASSSVGNIGTHTDSALTLSTMNGGNDGTTTTGSSSSH